MNTDKLLGAIELARYSLRRIYLGEKAGDERAVANTPVPWHLRETSEALNIAYAEALDDDCPPAWGRQRVMIGPDGLTRLENTGWVCLSADAGKDSKGE